MADPHHVEALDGFDQGTVRAYRAGIGLAAVGLGVQAWLCTVGSEATWGWLFIDAAAGLCVVNLHLYLRSLRWLLAAVVPFGLWLQLAAVLQGWGDTAFLAGVGFVFVALSAVALKEQFCFRVPIMPLVPAALAGSLVPLVLGLPVAAGAMLGVGAAVMLLLAVVKLRMPLHFDIGDKSKYQI